MCNTDVILTIDIGGSKFMPGLVDLDGNILACERREWTDVTPQGIVEQLVAACREVLAANPEAAGRVVAGGITIPAFADPVRGIWIDSDYLDVHDLPICDLLSNELGVPFYGDNDCNACVLAESYFGGARGDRDFLYMTVSSGVGGGTFIDGELFYGAHYLSGEMGLTICTPGGRPSLSGNQVGPLEMYASGPALAQNYVELGGPAEVDGHPVGGREIAAAAHAGDAAALAALDLEGRLLGRAIANAHAVLGFSTVVLGGGISLLFDLYEEPLMAEVRRLRGDAAPVVRATALGYEGAFLGAAACGIRGLRGFHKAFGAGDDDASVLEVSYVGKHFSARLVADSRDALAAPGAGDLGAFLVATGPDDPGTTLDDLWRDQAPIQLAEYAGWGNRPSIAVVERLGDALGRALAFYGMVLDPGTIHLGKGLSSLAAEFGPSVRSAVVRETFYQEDNLPYRIAWR